MSISQFVVSFIVGYFTSWKLSAVLTAMLPLLGVGGWFMAKSMDQGSDSYRTYEKAGGMAEEVLYQIKTVASFSNFEFEKKRYFQFLSNSVKAGIKAGFKTGFGIGFIIFIIYCSYALAVGYSTSLIVNQDYNSNTKTVFAAGDCITVLFSIIFGCFSLGQAAPNIKAIYEAVNASYEYIDLKQKTKHADKKENIEIPDLKRLEGKLVFRNIFFSYPSNPNKLILENFSFDFESGKHYALVGQSGCGKSTLLSLIERFYNPQNGSIIFEDKYDISLIDLNMWRSLIGYVPQEPVLFNTTIRNNIVFGRIDVSDEEIIEACQKASASDFIEKLGLDYVVGVKGSQLSGGQKQRVAIARAILKKPKFLILDEATSALDNKSEKEVKEALEIVSQHVTTITIAHKISTIINYDRILYMQDGQVLESGTHYDLVQKKGAYYQMVASEIQKRVSKKNSSVHILPETYKSGVLSDEDEDFEEDSNDDSIQEVAIEELDNSQEMGEYENKNLPYISQSNPLSPKKITFKKSIEIQLKDIEINENKTIPKKIRKPSSGSPPLRKFSDKPTSPENIRNDNNKKQLQSDSSPTKENVFDHEYFKKSRMRLLSMLKGEKCFVTGAMIAASCNGTIWPIYGILLADAIGVLSLKDLTLVADGGLKVSMMFLALAVGSGIALWMQNYFFYGLGEILTKKFREMIYTKFLNLHMGFFDLPQNTPGSLMGKLSSETTKINGVATSVIGQLLQTLVTLILGISLAMAFQWKLCLINLCFLPFIIGSNILQFKVQKGASDGNKDIESESGSILSESLTNTKTIFSYNMQENVNKLYSKSLEGYSENLYRNASVKGIFYGFSQFIIFGMYATLFYVGGKLFVNQEVTLQNMMRTIFIILFTALGTGVAAAFAGDYEAAKSALVSLYKVIDEPSQIDVEQSESGVKKENFAGEIEFKNVSFAYPMRPNNFVLKNLSFKIKPGQNVAFVGASGSGKSTIISLIERFYDVNEGQVLIDGIDIKEYSLSFLRKNIGFVMQEPNLFKRSIKENIRYGKIDAGDQEVFDAAKKAFIHDLIDQNADDNVQISGGQKQRVAIARAILKNPKIMLLDEATSALDPKLEDDLKKSLNNLMEGRTSVIVAHR
jgi:ABC-type multidrug transport system fused ATPase/permease subunit